MFSIETTIVLTRDESVLKEYLPEVISVLVSFSTGFSGLLTLIFIVIGIVALIISIFEPM